MGSGLRAINTKAWYLIGMGSGMSNVGTPKQCMYWKQITKKKQEYTAVEVLSQHSD